MSKRTSEPPPRSGVGHPFRWTPPANDGYVYTLHSVTRDAAGKGVDTISVAIDVNGAEFVEDSLRETNGTVRAYTRMRREDHERLLAERRKLALGMENVTVSNGQGTLASSDIDRDAETGAEIRASLPQEATVFDG